MRISDCHTKVQKAVVRSDNVRNKIDNVRNRNF